MISKTLEYAPALYKIFDEILVNAADNLQRDSINENNKITINQENNKITIFNDGEGI